MERTSLQKRRLRKVGDAIARTPKRYNQDSWHCGTKMCVAGFATVLTPKFQGFTSDDEEMAIIAGEPIEVAQAGVDYLGIEDWEADILFAGGWEPAYAGRKGLAGRVKAALYRMADGESADEVSL